MAANIPFRTGFGYDIHRLEENRKLMLGGVEVPFDKGLAGHSDADVLLHAICDAMLGSLALGDIGEHFPDTDPQYKNADSRRLLEGCVRLIEKQKYEIGNIDSTVVAEKPKLRPYIKKIRQSIADILQIGIDQVSVKATTSEQIGPIGRREGIAAFATALIVDTS